VLLSVQHILEQAVSELITIGKELLAPLEGLGTWSLHSESLDDVVASYSSLLDVIRDKIKNDAKVVAPILLAATLDIGYVPRFVDNFKTLERQDKIISRYTAKAHYGIAYILRMQRLQCHTNPSDNDIRDLLHTRNKLIASLSDVFERQNLQEDVWIDLDETQLFIPQELFQIPALARAVTLDGRRDCLWRPVGHTLFDNKVNAGFKFRANTDGCDVLGRSRLHLACALAETDQHVSDLMELPESRWPGTEMLGFNALHVAAIHGNTYIFRIAAACGFNLAHSRDMYPSAHTGRTYLQWAACLGHAELVEYLLEVYQKAEFNRMMEFLEYRDRKGDTALHLAARNGHTKIVKAILPHINWSILMRSYRRHTPFWAAVTGRHLDIMKLLGPFSSVDEDEAGGLTPLAEAARQGFVEGVRYLLSLKGVNLNSMNNCKDEATQKTASKTPLDFAVEGKHDECVEILEKHGALKWQYFTEIGTS
jgi:ankyrin repeat protein